MVKTVAVSGGVNVSVAVEGTGPAILLLHAGVSDRHMWDAQCNWLQARHQAVRWYWRGFGDTPYVPRPFSYAEDMVRIMEAVGLDQATLIGGSFGGAVGIPVAVQHAQRLERLVLVGADVSGFEAPNPPKVRELFQQGEEAWKRADRPATLALDEQIWLVGPYRIAADVDPAYLCRARELLRRGDQPANGAESLDTDWSCLDRLSAITVPVLTMVGTEDVPSLLEAARYGAQACRQAVLKLLEGAAHLPSLEIPDVFNRVLQDWLSRTGV